jgi:hypothetical protein
MYHYLSYRYFILEIDLVATPLQLCYDTLRYSYKLYILLKNFRFEILGCKLHQDNSSRTQHECGHQSGIPNPPCENTTT